MTWIGKKWLGHMIHIEAVDPLADEYAQLLRRNRVTPPVWTKKGSGEELVRLYGKDAFDLAFARNCLDHSYDAIQAVTNIVQITKPGGVIFLWHNQNEAERLSYQGLHQWNFRLQNTELIVWKGNRTFNVNRAFAQQLEVLRCAFEDGMIQAVYRKKAISQDPVQVD